MANQEGAGQGLLGIIAPQRERTATPVLPRPEARPAPEGPLKPKKKGLSKKARISLAGLAVVGAGAGAYEGYQNIPAVHQAVDSAFLDHIKGKLFSEKPSLVFDKTAEKQIIQAGVNAIAVSETELKKAYEEQSTQNTDGRPTVVFPAIFTADGQKIDYSFQPPLRGAKDSQTGQEVIIEFPGTIKTNLDKGMEIVVPAENAEVFQFPPRIIDGKQYFVGLWIKFQQNGETYAFGVSGADVRTFIPIGEVINAPLVPINEGGTLLLGDAKNGLKLPVGTSVARVDRNTNLEEGFNFSRYNPNNPHINARWESIRPNFVIDNSTGQLKLILPQ